MSNEVLNNFESHDLIWFVAVGTSRALVFAALHAEANANVSFNWTVVPEDKDL